MLLLLFLGLTALCVLMAVRIATSPTVRILSCLFAGWADRYREEAPLRR